MSAALLFTLLAHLVCVIYGYPTGAPTVKCDSMLPSPNSHGQPVTNSPSPYTLSVDKTTYSSGSNVVLTISGTIPFKGMLVEARQTVNGSVKALGTFSSLPANTKTIDCSGNQKNALTHSNNSERNSSVVTWVAPTSNMGDIHFQASVVHNTSVFWVEIKSPVLSPTGFPSNNGYRLQPNGVHIMMVIISLMSLKFKC